MGVILNYLLFDDTEESLAGAIALSAIIVLIYTVAGGLYSVAYTDCLQAAVGWTGCCVFAFYVIAKEPVSAVSCECFVFACVDMWRAILISCRCRIDSRLPALGSRDTFIPMTRRARCTR